ncbi:amino acid ABC transporter permease [Ostreibacterium oceani]
MIANTQAIHMQQKAWNNPKYRSLFFQLLLTTIVVVAGWTLFSNTVQNLESRGISSGFDFLKRAAGFEIDFKLISYTSTDSNGRVFFVGLLNTLLVSVLGIIAATIIGVVMGVSRLSKNWVIRKIATVYVELFRNTPLLLQIFFWYFAVLSALPSAREVMAGPGFLGGNAFLSNRGLTMPKPVFESGAWLITAGLIAGIVGAIAFYRYAKKKQFATGEQLPVFWVNTAMLLGLPLLGAMLAGMPISFDHPEAGRFNFSGGMTIPPEFLALWFSLSIYTGAFIAENVRAGIMSVSHGQTEAAFSLGIKPSYTLRLVIIPQALRVIIPPLASQYLNLAKNSSLAAAIAYPELVSVFSGTVLNNTGQAIECVALTMLAYLTISLSIAAFMNWYNKRVALVER